MTKQSTENILVPAKFISLMLHLLIVTMAYFSYVLNPKNQHDNIIVAYPNMTSKTDTLYIGGRASFLACNSITLIFLFAEIVILFIGTNMFRERVNFVSNFYVIQTLFCTFQALFFGVLIYSSSGNSLKFGQSGLSAGNSNLIQFSTHGHRNCYDYFSS